MTGLLRKTKTYEYAKKTYEVYTGFRKDLMKLRKFWESCYSNGVTRTTRSLRDDDRTSSYHADLW